MASRELSDKFAFLHLVEVRSFAVCASVSTSPAAPASVAGFGIGTRPAAWQRSGYPASQGGYAAGWQPQEVVLR